MSFPTQEVLLCPHNSDHCKRLADPLSPTTFHMEVWLPFTEVAKLPRGNANVRPASQQKKPYRDMMATVESSPESFHLKNRGITYICERFEFDNSSKKLKVTIPRVAEERLEDENVPKFGVADGGHTHSVVVDAIQKSGDLEKNEGWTQPFVRVHLLAGNGSLISEVEGIVEALNTSSQVQAYTLDEYQNKFDELKQALKAEGFDVSFIGFRENEDKPWNVVEIVQRLACFLKERWENTHPASMYKSKAKALKLFTDEDTRPEFRRLYGILKDLIVLPEMMESMFSSGNLVQLKSLGKLRTVKKLKKPQTRPGTSYETNYKLDMAALLPMAGAFRELLQLKGDRYSWRVDPRIVFERCAEQLYKTLVDRVQKAKVASQLGSDMEYWGACAQIVLRTQTTLMEEIYSESVENKS